MAIYSYAVGVGPRSHSAPCSKALPTASRRNMLRTARELQQRLNKRRDEIENVRIMAVVTIEPPDLNLSTRRWNREFPEWKNRSLGQAKGRRGRGRGRGKGRKGGEELIDGGPEVGVCVKLDIYI